VAEGARLPLSSVPLPERSEGAGWPSTVDAMVRALLAGGERRFSIRRLARTAGMSEGAVRDILRGIHRPTLESGLKLAAALGITPQRLQSYVSAVRRMPGIERRRKRHKRSSGAWFAWWDEETKR